jgi:hypothetical protein
MPRAAPLGVPPRPRERRTVLALAASLVVHAILVWLLVFGLPIAQSPAARASDQVVARAVSLPPYVKPPARRPNQPAPKAAPAPPPPPPIKETELGPDSKRPDERAREAAAKQATAPPPPTPEVQPPAPPTTASTPAAPPSPSKAPPHIATPAELGFKGPMSVPTTVPTTLPAAPPSSSILDPSTTTEGKAGQVGLRSTDEQRWENSFDDQTSGKCVKVDLGKNPDGTPVLASVTGTIFDTDHRTPMPGAHLEIMGTTFGTFTDSRGDYRLEFDPHLLTQCRIQYVRVVAPGYLPQRLTLMIGNRVRSDDVVMQKH